MIKLAMTPRVGAGAQVYTLLFESRLNFEIVKRGNGCDCSRQKNSSQTSVEHCGPGPAKQNRKPSGDRKNAVASSVFVTQNEIAPPTHFAWPFSLV